MARIAGVDLPREKRVEIGLTYIYGIGRHTANEILAETKIDPNTRVKDLDENDVAKRQKWSKCRARNTFHSSNFQKTTGQHCTR